MPSEPARSLASASSALPDMPANALLMFSNGKASCAIFSAATPMPAMTPNTTPVMLKKDRSLLVRRDNREIFR